MRKTLQLLKNVLLQDLLLYYNYGAEKDIAKDFAETITYAQPFIIKNEKTINDDLKVLWINSFSKAKEIFNL